MDMDFKERIMGHTTTFQRLANELPESETHWREIAAKAHRTRALPGDEAIAKTHELHSWEIKSGLLTGSSRQIHLCPACLLHGKRYILLFMGGCDRCGCCGWDGGVK